MNNLIVLMNLVILAIIVFLVHRAVIDKYISELQILQNDLFIHACQHQELSSESFLFMQRQIELHIEKAEILTFGFMRDLHKFYNKHAIIIEKPSLSLEYDKGFKQLNFRTIDLMVLRAPLLWLMIIPAFIWAIGYLVCKAMKADGTSGKGSILKEAIYSQVSNRCVPEYEKLNMAV